MTPSKSKFPAVVIGILGGVGSGKTTVAGMFRQCGAWVLEADRLAHKALRQPGVKRRLVRLWGRAMLDRGGAPDHKKIGGIVFKDPHARVQLESIVHPVITKMMKDETSKHGGLVIWDAALLGETGFHRQCDVLVFVDAPESRRLERVRSSRHWTPGELRRRERAQMGLNKKRQLADYIIKNHQSKASTLKQVRTIAKHILNSVMN